MEELIDERDPPRAGPRDVADQEASSTAPRPSRPTRSSSSASRRCRDSGSPPGSARTASRAPAASARRWPSGSSTASRSGRSGRSTSGASGRHYRSPALHPGPHVRGALEVLRHQVPRRGAEGGPAVARLARLRAPRRARRCLRREVGLGARQLVRSRTPPRGDESLRPRGWAGENWSPAIAAEAAATRTAAGLFDESSFAKLEVVGPGALDLLQRLCGNDVARPVGRVTYTQMLNARGGIECDLSVIRTAEDRFLLVTGTAFGTHDRRWIERHAPRDGSVHVADVTASRACFGLWGPQRPRHPPGPHQDLPRARRLPVHDGARRSPSATSPASPSA